MKRLRLIAFLLLILLPACDSLTSTAPTVDVFEAAHQTLAAEATANPPTPTNTATPFIPTPTDTSTGLPLLTQQMDTWTKTPTPLARSEWRVMITTIFYDGVVDDNEPDEYVEIRNDVTKSVNLRDWTLRDKAGHVFTFPHFVMNPGRMCRIYTNEKHKQTCGFSFESSDSEIWDNDGDCAYLRDADGNAVNEYCY